MEDDDPGYYEIKDGSDAALKSAFEGDVNKIFSARI